MNDQIEEWKTGRFDKDPLDAFRWARDIVEAAAELHVVKLLLRSYAEKYHDGTRDAVALRDMEEQTQRRCESQGFRSSSMMANIAEEAERVAYVKHTKELRRWVKGKAEAAAELKAVEAEVAGVGTSA